ncbi:MAG: sucrase ferredoxin [Myxococcota bacterium]
MESCSESTRLEGEPLAGTAGQADALIAVSWPKPLWDPEKAVRSKGLPADLERLVGREERAGRKVSFRVFQRGSRPPTDRPELIGLAAGGRSLRIAQVALPDLSSRIASFLEGGRVGPSLEETLVLVCTDGRHDRCCATHGAPLYRALRTETDRRGDLQVAESSHLGGHRFAGSVLFLPGGEMYGRLRCGDVPGLLDAWSRGTVLVPRFRGRLGAPETLQVAEVYVRGLHPEAEGVELELTEHSKRGAWVRATVRSREATHRLEVECLLRSFESPTRCSKHNESRERWIAASVRQPSGTTG